MTDSAPSTVTVRRDLPFREADGETLALDLYDDPAATGPKPVAVLVRGGAFCWGDKGEFARHAIDLAAAGFLVVEPQYRLAPEWTFPAALVDVKAAIEWVRAEGDEYGADTDRIVGVGHSAGANLVALAALTADEPGFEPEAYPGRSSALSAVVGYAGVYDFPSLDDATGEGGQYHRQYLGGGLEDEPAAYDLASPVAQVGPDASPTLLLHGDADETVPPSQSELLADALSPVADVTHETLSADHGFPFHGAHYDDVFERTLAFLRRVGLAGEGASGRPGDGVDGVGDGIGEPGGSSNSGLGQPPGTRGRDDHRGDPGF